MGDVVDYKEKYFRILRRLDLLHRRITCDRCPVFRQCCAGCNELKYVLKEEKKDG